MQSRTRVALVVLSLVAGCLGAMGLASSSSSAATAATRPKVGQCHQLTWRQSGAIADAKRAVSCSARHNLQTIAVVRSPTSLASLTPDQQADLGARLCSPKFDKALGRTATVREQTVYSLSFFAPTPAQIAAGARWIRCDVGKVAVDHFVTLPRHRLTRPIIGSRIKDSERRCLTSRWYITPCTSKHVQRSMKAFVVPQTTYPTGDQVGRLAARKCPTGWDNVTWASEWGWQHGNHVAVCYDKTRR